MTYYDIVIDSKWMVDLFGDLQWMILNKQLTYLAICNLKMACYEIVDDSKWMVNLFGDPKPQNGLLLHCSLF